MTNKNNEGEKSSGAIDTHPARAPEPVTLVGRYILVEPLDIDHAEDLFAALAREDQEDLLRYTTNPVCTSAQDVAVMIQTKLETDAAQYFAFIDHFTNRILGFGALMRADRDNRVIEIGNLLFTAEMRGRRSGSEAIYLLLRLAFEELGYRRVEWKCDSENLRSRKAALRYGFAFEGVFRQHMIVGGRNRDTAWFSMLDGEWPHRREAFEEWLQTSNFDALGQQTKSLADLIAARS